MKAENVLKQLGFTDNEIKVFLALNRFGENGAGKIAELSKLERSSCYSTIKSLVVKGVVSYHLKGRIKYFKAVSPKQLLANAKELVDEVRSLVPKLESARIVPNEESEVQLFKGEKGIWAIFKDIAHEGKDNFVFGSEGSMVKRMPLLVKHFDKWRKEKGIKTTLVIGKVPKKYQPTTSRFRVLENVAESPATTNIYGDKVAIIIWSEEPEGVIIDNAAVAKAYKSYFDVLWRAAKSPK